MTHRRHFLYVVRLALPLPHAARASDQLWAPWPTPPPVPEPEPLHLMSLAAAALLTSSLSSFSEATAAIVNGRNRPHLFDILASFSYLALIAFPPSTLNANPLYPSFRCRIYCGVEKGQEGTHRVHFRASAQREFSPQPPAYTSISARRVYLLPLLLVASSSLGVGSGSGLVHGTGDVMS